MERRPIADRHERLLKRLEGFAPDLPPQLTERAQDRPGYAAYALGQVALACFAFGRISAAQELGAGVDEDDYRGALERCVDACGALVLAVGGPEEVRALAAELPEHVDFAVHLAIVPDALALAGIAFAGGDVGGGDALLKRAAVELLALLAEAEAA